MRDWVAGFFVLRARGQSDPSCQVPTTVELTKTQRDFFESRIRPVLIEHCHECHSTGAVEIESDFLLDTREGIRKGGSSGRDAVIPGDPAGSQLLEALRHSNPELQMPPKTKLPDTVIADFETWIAMGAPDPREGESKLPRELAAATHWAFQPMAIREPPAVKDADWPRDRNDYFILNRIETAGLQPVRDADRRTLIRRTRPPHSPTPVPVLTVSGAAGAKANSCRLAVSPPAP